MNSRIQEFAESHGFIHEHMTPGERLDALNKYERFAGLIAQECAKLAMTQHHSTRPQDHAGMDLYDRGCDDAASTISGLILSTFS